jgi:hypothetical protein
MNYNEFKRLHKGLSHRQIAELLLSERTELIDYISKQVPEGSPITHVEYRDALGAILLRLSHFVQHGDRDTWISAFGLLQGAYASLIDLNDGKGLTIFHRPKAKKGQARHERKMMAHEVLCNIVAVETGSRRAKKADLDKLERRTKIPAKDFKAALKVVHGKPTHNLDLSPTNVNINPQIGKDKTIDRYVELYRLWKPTVD